MLELQFGDIFRLNGAGLSGWLSENLTVPHTKAFHHGLIGDPVYDIFGELNVIDDKKALQNAVETAKRIIDYESRESISKGPSTCRFFDRYAGQYIEIYRVVDATNNERIRAVRSTSLIGAYPYDYIVFLFLFLDVLRLILTGHRPPYKASQFKYVQAHRFICTAEVAWAWAGKRWSKRRFLPSFLVNKVLSVALNNPLIPPDQAPIPSAFQEAIDNGKLKLVFKGYLTDDLRR